MNTSTTPTTGFQAGRPRHSLPIRSLARAVEPIAGRMAGSRFFPLWAILRHTGRTSGTAYATPVVALATADGFVIPLPFGDATQWARNLFAAGGGTIRFAGREHAITDPRILERDEAGRYLPAPLRFMCDRLGLRQFVLVRRTDA
jgi:deazaflavin-dependent oxidoreductase (nitroreductase family)